MRYARTMLALLLVGCARAPVGPTLPTAPRQVWTLQAGDAIGIDAWGDASLSGTYVLDAAAAIEIPICGRVELVGADEGEAATRVRRCLVDAEVYADPHHVHVRVVHRGATVTVHTGESACVVRYEPGITVVTAVSSALGLGQGRGAGRAVIRSGGSERTIDVDAIIVGDAADEALAPGDEVVLSGRKSARCVARMGPAPVANVPDPESSPVPTGSTCGELMLEEAELAAEGKRERHPEVIATARAREVRCAADPQLGSLPAACANATQRHAELSIDYGPVHPTMLGLAAALAVCDAKLGTTR